MAVFATHVVVMRDFEAVKFAPGDELPEWAEALVGAHCLVPEAEPDSDSDNAGDADGEPDTDEDDVEAEEPTPAPADAPDFTAPAPRRNSRTRK
jgi:hypothetical protein